MRSNPTFERALTLLAHPLTLGALALLLLNDHVLRRLWPSWVTGKLGDFAWLFFAPFALATVIAWVLPHRMKRHEQVTFAAAFGLTGLIFGLIKWLPAIHGMAIRIFADAGMPLSLRRDPTDLLALPALVLAYWLWYRTVSAPMDQPRLFPAKGLIALPLAALLTIANSPAPELGIGCIQVLPDGSISAGSSYFNYISTDGGLTWAPEVNNSRCDAWPGNIPDNDWTEVAGPVEGAGYRFIPGKAIERSPDGGQTWQPAYTLEPVSEAQQTYFSRTSMGYPTFQHGPLVAAAHPASGNMLFGMGYEGILVHTSSGEWQWVTVGGYGRLQDFPTVDAASLLLGGQILMAVLLALLVFSTLALRSTWHWIRIVVLVLAWLAWLAVTGIFPPATATGYTATITVMGMIACAVLIVPLVTEQIVRLVKRQPGILPTLALTGLGAALLFFLPYVLWVYSTLPLFTWATIFSLVLALAVLIAGFIIIRSKFPNPA